MFRKLRNAAKELSAYLSFWPFIGGTVFVSGISGLAAWATTIVQPYAPLSWIAAALVGGVWFVAIALGVVVIRNSIIAGSIRRRFYEQPDRTNPLKRNFEKERVSITDLAPPMGGAITDKTFDHCELIGPANIILTGSGGAVLAGNYFTKTDAVSTAAGANPQTAVVFHNCRFVGCHFFHVTLLMHEHIYAAVNKTIGGLNWITPVPKPPPDTPNASNTDGDHHEFGKK